jgi:hypothetical protein
MPAGATYEPIATNTLGSAAASITFSSIPATYTDLRIVLVSSATYADVRTTLGYRFNGDSSTNYSFTRVRTDGSTRESQTAANVSYQSLGYAPANSTSNKGLHTIDVFSYAGSTYKTSLATASADQNSQGNFQREINLWRSTSGITSVVLFDINGSNFVTGTIATLYGIKAA